MMRSSVLSILACVVLVAGAAAQRRLPQPPLLLIKPVAEQNAETGMHEWKAHDPQKCQQCKGKKVVDCVLCEMGRNEEHANCPSCEEKGESACPTCAGDGTFYDPLDFMPCFVCERAGWHLCLVCGGKGRQLIAGGSDKGQKCPGCKGVGAHACTVCETTRRIEIPKIGKATLRESELDDLKKAREAVAEVHEGMKTFEVGKNLSKTIKAYEKMLKPMKKPFPFIKEWTKLYKDTIKQTDKGTKPYTNHGETMRQFYVNWDWRGQVQLMYLDELLAVCVERAEKNEAAEAAAKKE